MPDVPQWQPALAPTLAIAADLTDLCVCTWGYASPLRPAWSTAWEAHSMSLLTEGRFEMGIGTGRPGIEDELRELGMPVAPPRERLAQVRETVATLRDLDGPDVHTPVVMAVRGPNAQALAVEVADTAGTPTACTPTSWGSGSRGARPTPWIPWSGSSEPMSTSTSEASATEG